MKKTKYTDTAFKQQTTKENPADPSVRKNPGTGDPPAINRIYKARLFEMIFSRKKELLELLAVVVNINPGHNAGLLAACKTLRDYSEYTYRVRSYARHMDLEDAVEQGITECIDEDILADFLRRFRAEAKSVSIYEYDEERHMRSVREEGRIEGEKRFADLTQRLLQDGRTQELLQAASDKTYREQLYREYQL